MLYLFTKVQASHINRLKALNKACQKFAKIL